LPVGGIKATAISMSLSDRDVPAVRLSNSQSSRTQSFLAAHARKATIHSSRMSILLTPAISFDRSQFGHAVIEARAGELGKRLTSAAK
jgi:hypothetical protein